jgi:putative nucleotidyltransferase with HDIG domain
VAVSLQLSKIPAFPPVAGRLLDLLNDESLTSLALTVAIESDSTVAALLLECVNSPRFGLGAKAESVGQAVSLAGPGRARKVALTLAIKGFLLPAEQTPDHVRAWRHTLATAFLTEELAWACSLPEDLGYLTGLFHDIGRMGMLFAEPAEYATALHLANHQGFDILELERTRFGMDHCELGRQLAESWNLPDEIRLVTGRHHDRPDSNEIHLLYLVQLGCRLADTLGFESVRPARGMTLDEIKALLPLDAQERFCPNPEDLQAALRNELALYAREPLPLPELALEEVGDTPLPDEVELPPVVKKDRGPSNLTLAVIGAIVAAILTILTTWR